jgi:(E)-4-hydroxy-3-methylbut-2-enyl-diphosphate synthase
MNPWKYQGLSYLRRPTRTVHVGEVAVGSEHPIRVQSMTTPATSDTQATVDQIERLIAAGCEIARVTVPTSRDADNLPNIRAELKRRGLRVPLVADIHFTPAAAMKAVEHVEKVRINPGNFADKKKFNIREYTDAQYDEELERIGETFSPLVLRARELGVAIRVGTNHGSLSDRIMNRYGDTPEGMVESALEFVRICREHDYHALILSMKASNPLVVLQAYRLLAVRMAEASMDYPLHLGVTEAGDGEDGRIKSAIGIGTLLEEGLGDTIRVSLTEDPVEEIPVACALVAPFNATPSLSPIDTQAISETRDPFGFSRRLTRSVKVGPNPLGGDALVCVETALHSTLLDPKAIRDEIDSQAGVRVPADTRPETVSVNVAQPAELEALERLSSTLQLVAPRLALSARINFSWPDPVDDATLERWLLGCHRLHLEPGQDDRQWSISRRLLAMAVGCRRTLLLELGAPLSESIPRAIEIARSPEGRALILAISPTVGSPLFANRALVAALNAADLQTPIVLRDSPTLRSVDPLLAPSATLGGLLCDGSGDAILVEAESADASRKLAFNILQASRVRTTRTEFISCPSCGRTLFDLEQTTARIKERTHHLKGLKIAVMGCIVNGPGEMADADFGYVGWGEDKIALFVGKDMVAKDIPTDVADQRLVELIKEHGRWVEPGMTEQEETAPARE